LRPKASDDQTVALAKWLVPVVMLVAVYFTLTGNATIVAMLLVGYSFVTQLFPAVIASLMPRNPATPAGAFAGFWLARSSPPSSASLMRPSARCFPPCRKQSATSTSASSRLPHRRQRSEQDAHSFGRRHAIRDDRR
jgi:hypothetical protein